MRQVSIRGRAAFVHRSSTHHLASMETKSGRRGDESSVALQQQHASGALLFRPRVRGDVPRPAIESNAYSVLVQAIGDDVVALSKVSVVAGDVFVVKMYRASDQALVDCSFDFAVFSRSDCKLQSKVDGATGAPLLETNFGLPAAAASPSTPQILTFSSWNVPMLGPTDADAMNETLLSDDGTGPEAQISLYYTNDYTTPHDVSYGFDTYTAGDLRNTVYNAYADMYGGTAIPWLGKHIGPSTITHPEDSNIVLSHETGDFTAITPEDNSADGSPFHSAHPKATAFGWASRRRYDVQEADS
eukprot:1201733-Pleurochrysis_carterae.AAC.1